MKLAYITEENDIEVPFWKAWGFSLLLGAMTYLAFFVVFFALGMLLGLGGIFYGI